ncbi:MAG: hypothetical protein ACXAC7_06465 [Candidatus Hodarchaeales archaeon]|jgi:hypothetical protein
MNSFAEKGAKMLDFYYGLVLLFEVVMCIIIGIFIIKRDPSININQIFFLVMLSFGGYLFFESINYLLNIDDLATIDLFRDFSVFFSSTSVVLLVFTALLVQHGDIVIERKVNLLAGFLTIIIIVIIGIPYDSAEIVDNSYIIYNNDIIGKIFLLFIPMFLVFFSMFQYLKIRQSSDDPILRNKLLRLAIGLLLIFIGIGYFAVFPSFRYPGHISYILGLLVLFWAFR